MRFWTAYILMNFSISWQMNTAQNVYDIKKNRDNIQKFVLSLTAGQARGKLSSKLDIQRQRKLWFRKETGTHISGLPLAMKAKFLLQGDNSKIDFVAIKGWLGRFKSSHGIRLVAVSGEKLSNVQPAQRRAIYIDIFTESERFRLFQIIALHR